MPTRRIFELIVVTGLALRPVFGLGRLWAAKAFMTSEPGSLCHGVAEVVSVVL